MYAVKSLPTSVDVTITPSTHTGSTYTSSLDALGQSVTDPIVTQTNVASAASTEVTSPFEFEGNMQVPRAVPAQTPQSPTGGHIIQVNT